VILNYRLVIDFSAPRQALTALMANLTRAVTLVPTAEGAAGEPASRCSSVVERITRGSSKTDLDRANVAMAWIGEASNTPTTTDKFISYGKCALILDQWAAEPLSLARPRRGFPR
jgi:hypothetical protein